MALQERSRFAAGYHTLVALLLLLGGGALLGVGIWVYVTDRGGRLDLDYTGSNVWNIVLNFGVAGIIAGGFLLLSAVVSLIALSRKCLGKVFRVIYVLVALLITAVLVFIAVITLLIFSRRDSAVVKDFVRDAWIASVQEPEFRQNVCTIQDEFDCRGFDDGDCASCGLGRESLCTPEERSLCPACVNEPVRPEGKGCYNAVIDSVAQIFLPIGIVASILAFIVLVDVFVVCFI